MHLRFLTAVFVALALHVPCSALAEPSIIYVVRHSEKAPDGKDPELSEQGRVRAQNIAATLHRAGITSIFSSTTTRTQQTAQPLAQRSKLVVRTYDPGAPKALVEKVKAQSGVVLVVGHSNTVPELVRLFGGAPGADIADNEFDRMYQLIVGPNGAVITVLLTSLPATGTAP
ncbi:histidine phosphatase family protein [Massilia sp. TWR1-2-2]|uniref:histidine phosphatase family protein n=1 Tax=Massilia sp. TWR1-2-2 TaxID=2804584 RepID=UPI003CEB67B1